MVYTVCFYLCAQGGRYIFVGLECIEYLWRIKWPPWCVIGWMTVGGTFFSTVFPFIYFLICITLSKVMIYY